MARLIRLGRWVLVLVAAVGVVVVGAIAATGGYSETPTGTGGQDSPGRVEPINGSDVGRVTLTAEAARRLGITTVPVREEEVAGKWLLVIPYAAVLYDASGETWAFTSPEPLVFVRHQITVESIKDDRVYLSDGPPAGTAVVTVGVAELYGTEVGVGGDE
jgi:hypothetical protein